jgi:hypothetical protein
MAFQKRIVGPERGAKTAHWAKAKLQGRSTHGKIV